MVHVQSTPTEQLDNYIMYNLQLLGLSAALCTLLSSEATMSNEDKHVICNCIYAYFIKFYPVYKHNYKLHPRTCTHTHTYTETGRRIDTHTHVQTKLEGDPMDVSNYKYYICICWSRHTGRCLENVIHVLTLHDIVCMLTDSVSSWTFFENRCTANERCVSDRCDLT